MVAISSDSDDDDISSTIKRKHSRKKIEDSDSSCDENMEETSTNDVSLDQSNIDINKISNEDTISVDGLVIDESSKGQLESSNSNNNGDSDCEVENDNNADVSKMSDADVSKMSDADSNKDNDNSTNQNESINKGTQKKKGKLKNRIRCFDDESSDDEIIEKTRISKDSKNKYTPPKTVEDNNTHLKENITEDDDIIHDNITNDTEDGNEPSNNKILASDENVCENNVDDVLKNKDLYDADSESDDEVKSRRRNENEDEDSKMRSSGSEDESMQNNTDSKKEKRPGKDAHKEAKSEQQRLLREQKFRLPYHVPEVKPLKDFLLRVPVLKTKDKKSKQLCDEKETISLVGNVESVANIDNGLDEPKDVTDIESVEVNDNVQSNSEVTSNNTKSHIDNLFKQKPKLSFGNEDIIEFEESVEVAIEKPKEKRGVLDTFMERFEKHTKSKGRKDLKCKTTNSKSPSIPNVVIPEKEKIPGGRRVAFAEQMKLKIRKERAETLKELEKERKLLNEENSSEEEEEFEDGDEDYDEEEDAGEEVEVDDKVENADNNGDSSNDEELEKWNSDDRRKALEVEMEAEEEKSKKTIENNTNSVDFSIEGRKTPQPEQLEKDDIHWDDTSSTVSSFLPAGQGDPTGRKSSVDGRMTPFSKLMKSGLLDSTSNLNFSTNSNSQGLVGGIALPCEDTQDLYKETFEKKDEESQMVLNSFDLEETQYTQVIDSQGFLNDSKKSKRQLFDDDVKDGVNDFSQVIGLCSGKFDEEEESEKKTEGGDIGRLFNKNDEFSMTQVIGLCSGKFAGDGVTSTKMECADGSLSNPPMEHPFSSRVTQDDKPSDKLSHFSDSQENIFKLHDKKSEESDKPLGLSNIIDDNFDDNAMDFCTAPFSGQATEEDSQDAGEPSAKNSGVLSQTKFDVGNWLKEDNKMHREDSESRSEGSTSKTVNEHKTITKEVQQDDDNEDDVFADNEDDGVGSDDEENADEEEDSDTQVANEKEESEEEDGEEDVEENDEDENEVNEELLEYQDAISADKKKWSKSAFAEKEAELSGSDINSDAEELGSEYDEYEIDSDIEDLPTGEKLKSQVHKIHQKKLLDQDQREVRLLQELYIEDADRAYGKKRQRNFRWRNVADDDGFFNAAANSDEEVDELNLDNNISQKLERAEREKYISELEEREKASMDENSQSMLEMIKDPTKVIADKPVPAAKPRLSSKSDARLASQKRSGSFMSQTKSSFSHLTSTVKVGGQGGKAFVFQTAGEDDPKGADKENRVAVRKTPMSEPAKKKAKFNSHVESSESQSIFDLL